MGHAGQLQSLGSRPPVIQRESDRLGPAQEEVNEEWQEDDPDLSAPYFEGLYLPRSKLTATGVEAIAKGLFEASVRVDHYEVSSPHLNEDMFSSGMVPGYEHYEDFSNFCTMLAEKYKMEICGVIVHDDIIDEFTKLTDTILSRIVI